MEKELSQGDMDEPILVEWQEKDFVVPILDATLGKMDITEALALPQFNRNFNFINRRQIEEFCKECDRYKGVKPCSVGFGNQTRYVARQWCGDASINGQSCHMTKTGPQFAE